MAKQKRLRDNSRYREETEPLGSRSFEVNNTKVGVLLSVSMSDLDKLGLVPKWNPCAFISNRSMKSPRGRYAFLCYEDAKMFRSVYELFTGAAMKTHPKGNDYPLHVDRLVPFHEEIPERTAPPLPTVVPYSCSGRKSSRTDMAVYNPILQSVTDFVMYTVLCDIVNNHAVQGPRLLETKYLMLRTWIRSKTPALSGMFYDDRTRMMWVYQFRTSFPVCPTCHREFGRMKNIHLSKTYVAYQPHCSSRCARLDARVDAEYKASCIKRYGVDHPSKSKEFLTKVKNILIDKYGTDTTLKVPEVWEKSRETCRRKFGTDYPAQNKEIYNKVKSTSIMRYGVDNPLASPAVRAKARESLIERYGVDSPLRSKEIREKVALTNLKRYGVRCVAKNPDIMSRSIATRIRNQRNDRKPRMDGLVFDSGWELKFYDYCKNHGLDVEYHPCRLEYEYLGIKHFYYPDFRVGDRLYEVKGDCFLREDGTWKVPFRKKGVSDEQFAIECGQVEAKHRCVVDNGVIVVSSREINNLEQVLG